jgi:hypothetical protein
MPMRRTLTATLCTAAVTAFVVGASPASAAPAGVTADALRGISSQTALPVEQVYHRRRSWDRGWHRGRNRGWNRCYWTRRVSWYRGYPHSRWVRVCRRSWW